MENLNLAFDVAEKHLDIPRMLDAEGNTCIWLLDSSQYSFICAHICKDPKGSCGSSLLILFHLKFNDVLLTTWKHNKHLPKIMMSNTDFNTNRKPVVFVRTGWLTIVHVHVIPDFLIFSLPFNFN